MDGVGFLDVSSTGVPATCRVPEVDANVIGGGCKGGVIARGGDCKPGLCR